MAHDNWDYLATWGVEFVRVPIASESVRPWLDGPLDPTYLGAIKAAIAEAWARSLGCITDLHNFGYYAEQDKWRATVGYAGNAHTDVMIDTIDSWHMVQNIPNAQLIVYPDAGHGAQFQYPERFLKHAIQFLAEE
jgi:pimeloyl-ACP methyl ester carboxylesterase